MENCPIGAADCYWNGRLYERGSGERLHRHTIGQANLLIRGKGVVILDGQETVVVPPYMWISGPRQEHGFIALANSTLVVSCFCYWKDGVIQPMNVDLILQEGVSAITPEEAAIRASTLEERYG